ncbi:hypothetical protein RRG08_009147 [Elysia crispata]|uniref:Uncharacterized protein n=1 Tax=Elysia crispata TaxID=231223 RepID=A0AAE0Y6T6_9GAST|nr:hypothetical protein RRG08_009147 [Elysia crispata]
MARPGCSRTQFCAFVLKYALNGPNIALSTGCNLCDEWGGSFSTNPDLPLFCRSTWEALRTAYWYASFLTSRAETHLRRLDQIVGKTSLLIWCEDNIWRLIADLRRRAEWYNNVTRREVIFAGVQRLTGVVSTLRN